MHGMTPWIRQLPLQYQVRRYDAWYRHTTLASSLRAVAWNGVRDLVRNGELAPGQCLALAARHLPGETDGSIAGHVLGYARWTVADRYLPIAVDRRHAR